MLTQTRAEVQTQTRAEVLTQKGCRGAKLRREPRCKLKRVAEVKTPKRMAWKESSVVEKGSDAVCDVAGQDNISTADKG